MDLGSSEFRDLCLHGPCPACGRGRVIRHDWGPDGGVTVVMYCPAGCSEADQDRALDALTGQAEVG